VGTKMAISFKATLNTKTLDIFSKDTSEEEEE